MFRPIFYIIFTLLRVRIVFQVKNKGGFVPFHHQYLLAQLIKGMLVKGGQKEFIDYPFYNFSGLKGQTKISRQGLHFYSRRVTLVVASNNKAFIDYFLRVLFTFPKVDIGNLMLEPEAVELEDHPEITDASRYICISPIVVLQPSLYDAEAKKFISPETDTFSDLLFESTIQRMEQAGEDPQKIEGIGKFQLVPDEDYLNKIRESQKKFARIYPLYDQDLKYEIRGYTFPFVLYAPKVVQEFIFTCGLGQFCHKGFGMLDIANADPSKRAVTYEFAETTA
ncbi:conserved hypothetical protein [Imperialibacter sp. EC-SDR9]|nr:CRISPR-associated endoribonuclease Cas6 [Imperialibacter sp. 89]CAD5272704.1 CRISPR-associated endoribonuclease Cas6 [Imperialibacter sp. 75]VVT32339.1 conserved hypothetical protein [Imperialibacter sp. EC-SDR9]